MTIKPFAIQGADLTLGGVSLQAGTTGVVIPGVTQAANYYVEEVQDVDGSNPDTFGSDPEAVQLLDNAAYVYRSGAGSPSNGYSEAGYSVDELEDGEIKEINVEVDGIFSSADRDQAVRDFMWASTVADAKTKPQFDTNDWIQIAFKPKLRAGEVETIGGGGGSSALEGLDDVRLDGPSNGQALVWDSNDEVWKNQTISGGSGGAVVERTVNFPTGATGDTSGTIALDPDGNVYVCTTDWADYSEGVEFTVETTELYNLSQSGTLMSIVIAKGTYPEIDAILESATLPLSGWVAVNGPTTDGYTRECTAETFAGTNWAFTWTYVGGQDNNEIPQGTEFSLVYTQAQPAIWKQVNTGSNNSSGGSLDAYAVSNRAYPIVDWSIGEGYEVTVSGNLTNNLNAEYAGWGYVGYEGNGTYRAVVDFNYNEQADETTIQLDGLNDGDYTGADFYIVRKLSNFSTIASFGGALEITDDGKLFVTGFTDRLQNNNLGDVILDDNGVLNLIDGGIKFADGSVQTTAATGGVTVTTDLWIAAGYSPGGAAVVSSSNGLEWTTSDYMMDGLSIEKVAISPDRIVYIISGLPNGASSGLYHTDAPENTPVLADGTDFYGMGFPLEWREVNYLGGKFVAVGSYVVAQTISTDITSLTLAAGDRTTCQLTITNTNWDYNGELITITGATNTELNSTWRLVYNSSDTLGAGIYDIVTQDWQPTTFTSTDVSGAVITNFDGDCTFPMYAYSTDGVSWTYGTVDGMYIDLVLGETPVAAMADVAYNGTGYLIPVVDNKFSLPEDDPYTSGPGAFYITDLTGGANAPQFISGGGPNSLPGKYNNIAAYADGTFFVSDDQFTVFTNADPLNDPWVDHNIQSALTSHFGYSVGYGPGEQGVEILDSVAGTVGGEQMFVTTIDDGAVAWTTDNGTTWNVVTVDPIVHTMTLDTQGANTLLDFDGIETPRNWEKITIQVTGNDDVRWNGTYYAYNNTPDNIYKLYDGVEGNAIDSSAWTAPANPFTVTLTQGADLSKLHVADDTCIVFSTDTPQKLYRSTDMITWTSVFTNDAYYVSDIYYATRTATANNRLAYTDEETGYNSTAVLTYDFDVDVDNSHLNLRGDGSWNIGSENFRTQIYSAGPEEPTNIIVQANNRYWAFNDAGGFRFPDDTVQTTAYVVRNINLDGGGAAVHFEQEVGFVDGGFSATRHGVADPVFNGGDRLTENNQYNLDGGGA